MKLQKNSRARLCRDDYDLLRRQILTRDSWRCQFCGSRMQLELHHLRFRSQSGGDGEQNLITLCAQCHRDLHRSSRSCRAKQM